MSLSQLMGNIAGVNEKKKKSNWDAHRVGKPLSPSSEPLLLGWRRADLCCWRSKPACPSPQCANWVRFELIHLQFKYSGWDDDDDGTEERGSRHCLLSVPPFFRRETGTETAHLGPPTWTNWVWYQDVSSSLQTSLPSPASPTRTGSALETLPVGSFSLWALKLDLYFNIMLILCPWKQGTCDVFLRRFAEQKWNVLTQYMVP